MIKFHTGLSLLMIVQ